MFTTAELMLLSASTLTALTLAAAVWAWSWKGWLELKRLASEAAAAGQARTRLKLTLSDEYGTRRALRTRWGLPLTRAMATPEYRRASPPMIQQAMPM